MLTTSIIYEYIYEYLIFTEYLHYIVYCVSTTREHLQFKSAIKLKF